MIKHRFNESESRTKVSWLENTIERVVGSALKLSPKGVFTWTNAD